MANLAKTLFKIGQFVVGAYVAAPGIEDAASGGTLLVPSFIIGSALMADAVGVKLPKLW